MHRALLLAPELCDLILHPLDFRADGAGAGQDPLAHFGQPHPARGTDEQRQAEFALGLAEGLGQAGLRPAERLGGSAQAAVFGDRDEGLDMLDTHGDKRTLLVVELQYYSRLPAPPRLHPSRGGGPWQR